MKRLCSKCKRRPASNGKKQCNKCRERHSAYQRATFADSLKRGECPRCMCRRVVKNKKACRQCLARQCKVVKSRSIAAQAQGRCSKCHKLKPRKGLKTCDECYRRERKRRLKRHRLGICKDCPRKVKPGSWWCPKHSQEHAERIKLYKARAIAGYGGECQCCGRPNSAS